MTWVRLEDNVTLHPKILRLSDGAFRLWVNGLAFANRATTDGRIDKALVASLNHAGKWSPRQLSGFVSELVGSLWIDTGEHYEIHDYDHHQSEAMKERVERNKRYEREKKRKQREDADRKKYGIPVSVPANVPAGQTTGHDGEAPREASVPIRPVPSRSLTTFESDAHGTGPIVGGVEPETVRLAYVERWEKHAPGKRPPMVARGFGGAVWAEMARAFVDVETTTQILDAAFTDPFVRSTGWTPNAILGAMARLSTADVRASDAATGSEAVTTPNSAVEDIERRLRAARAYAVEVAGTDEVLAARQAVNAILVELRAANAARDAQREAS